MKNEVTPVVAARLLGVSRLYVYELLASGLLKGRKVMDRWLILSTEIERYRRAHPRIGSTIKARSAEGGRHPQVAAAS